MRTSIGPRAARVHVGAGRTGISTGVGPATFYTSLSGSRRRSSTGRSRTSVAAVQRQIRAADKAQQAQELKRAFEAIMNLHREDFPPAQAPVASAPEGIDEKAIRAWHEQLALKGLGMFQRGARAQAKLAAEQGAQQEIAKLRANSAEQQRQWQQHLDAQWAQLLANDPDLVLSVLSEAFADNDAPAVAVGMDGSSVALVVLVPGIEAVPERLPTKTDAGNLSLRKLTKTVRSGFYSQLVAGYVLTTIREAFAVAPGLTSAHIVAIRTPGRDAYGHTRVECLLAARFAKAALQGVRWDLADAATVLNDASVELLLNQRGAAKELQPLDLAKEPELADLLTKVDVEDLTDGTLS